MRIKYVETRATDLPYVVSFVKTCINNYIVGLIHTSTILSSMKYIEMCHAQLAKS